MVVARLSSSRLPPRSHCPLQSSRLCHFFSPAPPTVPPLPSHAPPTLPRRSLAQHWPDPMPLPHAPHHQSLGFFLRETHAAVDSSRHCNPYSPPRAAAPTTRRRPKFRAFRSLQAGNLNPSCYLFFSREIMSRRACQKSKSSPTTAVAEHGVAPSQQNAYDQWVWPSRARLHSCCFKAVVAAATKPVTHDRTAGHRC